MVTKFAGSRGVLAETAELAHHLSGPEVSQIVVEHGNTSPIWRAVFDFGRGAWIRRGGTGTSSWTGSTTATGTRHRSSGIRCTRAWNPIFAKVWSGEVSGLAAAAEANRLADVIVSLKTLHPTADVLQAKL